MSTQNKPFYGNGHDSPETKAGREERNRKIVELLDNHSVTEVAEMYGLSTGSISHIAKKAGLPPRWLAKRADAAKEQQQPAAAETEPQMYVERTVWEEYAAQPEKKHNDKSVGSIGPWWVTCNREKRSFLEWFKPDRCKYCQEKDLTIEKQEWTKPTKENAP